MLDIAQAVQDRKLSKTEKKIASYLMEDEHILGLNTVMDLAVNIGVSDTSVIRFLRSIGFKGFSDFKKTINDEILDSYNRSISPWKKFNNAANINDDSTLLEDVLNKVTENIAVTSHILTTEKIYKVKKMLKESDMKYILGFRGSSSCAEYLQRKLVHFLPHTVLCTKAESSAVESIIDAGPKDCLMLFSFPQYAAISIPILKFARKNYCKIIVVTDNKNNVLAQYADEVIELKVDGLNMFNSYVAPLIFIDALMVAFCRETEPKEDARMENLDNIIDAYNLY